MELICLQNKFKKAISNVEKVTSKQNLLSILKNILIETKDGMLSFSATNLEIGIICKIGAKIKKEGKIAVPAKLISNFINNISQEENMEIKLNNNILQIKCGKYKANINCFNVDEFPIIPNTKKETQIKLNSFDVKDVINKLLNSVGVNDSRPEFMGVNIFFKNDNEIIFASTDSFRLSEYKTKSNNKINEELIGKNIIVPVETIREINKIIDDSEFIEISIDNNQIFFKINNVKLVSRLINNKYPDYNQIIPTEFKTDIIINKNDLLQAVKIASFFTKTNDGEIKIEINSNNNILKIKSQTQEIGETETDLSIKIKGENQDIILNPRYFIDGINNFDTENISISINNNLLPMVMRGINKDGKKIDNYLHIIMPIKK